MAVINNPAWVEFFIQYKNLPELWKVKSTLYKNKDLRNKAYNKLLEFYKKIDSAANLEILKNKLNNLKTCYRRELRKIIQSKKSGVRAEEQYSTSLWYFDLLDFLKDQEFTVDSKECKSEVLTFIQKKGIRDHIESSSKPCFAQAVDNIKHLNRIKPTQDEADIYAASWAVSFRKLTEEQKLFAKKSIDDILLMGQLKQLTLNTVSFIQNELLCSSSSSDDDDEFRQIFKKRKTCHRTKNFISDVILNYSEKEFKEKFHVTKETANFLIEMYAKSSAYELRKYKGGRTQIPASKHIFSYLWFCSNNDSMREICSIFDMTLSSFSGVVQKVTSFITEEITSTAIKFPKDEESKQAIADEFEKISGFPNVLGCIDTICISIRALRRKTRPLYTNQHDSKITLILQGICDSKSRFLDISNRVPSTMPESRIFNLSLISKDIEEMCGSTYHLLGDASYPIREFLLTPYSGPHLIKSEAEFNTSFSLTRIKIENAFGMLKSRFRQLNRLDFQNIETIASFYLACCSLHNLCIDRNDFWSPNDDKRETTCGLAQEIYNCLQDNNEQDGLLEEMGKAKRDIIANSFFS